MDISLKRIIAYIIDIALVTVLVAIISNIKIINPYFEAYNENYEKYTELVENDNPEELESTEYKNQIIEINYEMSRNNIVNGVITIVGLVLYFGVAQMLLKGQTFGKKVMNLQLVGKNEHQKLNIGHYLIRTVILNNVIFRVMILVGVYFLTPKSYYNYSTIISFIESAIESIIVLMIVLKRDNRGLHDIIAQTKVIDLKKQDENIEEELSKIDVKEKNKSQKLTKK